MRRALAGLLLSLAGCEPSYVIGGVEGVSRPLDATQTCDAGGWPTSAGSFERAIRWQGVERSYGVVTPAGYSPCRPSPVVVLLRGQGAFLAPDAARWDALFYERASSEGYVVIEPRATQVGVLSEWDAPLAPAEVAAVDDVGFVSAVLGEVQGRDPGRTFLVGGGDGGTFAHTLAARLPVFAAMIVVNGVLGGQRSAGAPLEGPPLPQAPLSVLLVHGRDNAIFPIAGGPVGGQVLLGVEDAEAFWAAAAQCNGAPVTSKNGRVTTRVRACPSGRHVGVVALDGVGHWWPEDALALRFRMSLVAFEFFSNHAQ